MDEQKSSKTARALAKKRWKGTTAEDVKAFAASGGNARAAKLSKARRVEIAKKAVAAREAKRAAERKSKSGNE